jgi:hypothetical protein
MPHLPSHTLKYWICIGDRAKLEFRWRRKLVTGENGCSLRSLLRVLLPFYVSSPARVFFCEADFCLLFFFTGFFACSISIRVDVRFRLIFDRLVEKGEFSSGKSLLELPFIYPL